MTRSTRWATALALCVMMLAQPVSASPPGALSYQGVLTNASGVVVPDGQYTLRFEIFATPTSGTHLFDQQIGVAVTDGLYNVILTSITGNPLRDLEQTFESATGNLYMQVTIVSADPPLAGTPLTLTPRQQIASVPYALVAGRADSADALASSAGLPSGLVDFDSQSVTGVQTNRFNNTAWNSWGAQPASVTAPSTGLSRIFASLQVYVETSAPSDYAVRLVDDPTGVKTVLQTEVRHDESDSKRQLTLFYSAPAVPGKTYNLSVEAQSESDTSVHLNWNTDNIDGNLTSTSRLWVWIVSESN